MDESRSDSEPSPSENRWGPTGSGMVGESYEPWPAASRRYRVSAPRAWFAGAAAVLCLGSGAGGFLLGHATADPGPEPLGPGLVGHPGPHDGDHFDFRPGSDT